MLTSDIYVRAVEQLQEKKEEAAKAKEKNKNEREETKRRKLLEREEERRQREARAIELAEARARKVQESEEVARAKALKREEAARLKAERATLLARECALKAAMVPRKRESRRDQVSMAAESAEARQIESHPARGGRREGVSSPNVNMHAQQGEFSFFNNHPATYASSSHGQFVFNHPIHQFVAPLQSTLSSQPSAMFPHLSAMPQFILPHPATSLHPQPRPLPPRREQ
jgi:hypothetical protein